MLLTGYSQNIAYRLPDLAEALCTTCEDLARTTGLEFDTLDGISLEGMQRLREMVAILDNVEQRFNSLPAAYEWYRSAPLPGFSGQTAMQLVLVGRGGDVRDYIDAVDVSVHA